MEPVQSEVPVGHLLRRQGEAAPDHLEQVMPYQPDVRIMPALIRLHECLCAELERSGLGDNCDCALVHGNGANVAPPAVGHGYAWIGLQAIFPSTEFPTATGSRDSCPAPLAATINVGLIR